jgi:hypothetical protein
LKFLSRSSFWKLPVRCLRLTASVQRSRRLKYRACALAVSQSRTIDIYSRVDGALAGLLARHLKSCDSVDSRRLTSLGRLYRLTAGEGEATAGERDTRRQRLATARSLQRSRVAPGWRTRKIACQNGGEP